MKVSDRMWARLLSSTQQPSFLTKEQIEIKANKEQIDSWITSNSNNGNGSSHDTSTTIHFTSSEYVDHVEEALQKEAEGKEEEASTA